MHNKNIRFAEEKDFEELYKLAKSFPELRVSASEEFMDPEEFFLAIQNKDNIFLVSEGSDRLTGFLYATTDDLDKPLKKKWGCLVYLAVKPEFRKQGIAKNLYERAIVELKKKGITNLYGWANVESDGAILEFMRKQGFTDGHNYRWMDKEI